MRYLILLTMLLGSSAHALLYVREYVCRVEAQAMGEVETHLTAPYSPSNQEERNEWNSRIRTAQDLAKARLASIADRDSLKPIDVLRKERPTPREQLAAVFRNALIQSYTATITAVRWLVVNNAVQPDNIFWLRTILSREVELSKLRFKLYKKLAENIPLNVSLDFVTYRELQTHLYTIPRDDLPSYDSDLTHNYRENRNKARRMLATNMLPRPLKMMLADQMAFIEFLENRRPLNERGAEFDDFRSRFSLLVDDLECLLSARSLRPVLTGG
jgi:hypothetical protein